MKTFIDKINESNDTDILKSYIVNGIPVRIKASDFKIIIQKNTAADIFSKIPNKPTLKVSLTRKKNSVKITASEFCSECEGTGELECYNCGGSGICTCMECDNEHDCPTCEGEGIVECETCNNS